MNLTTSFLLFMEMSLKLLFLSMIQYQQTTSAYCTEISFITQCQKVYLFDSAVEYVGCYFYNDKGEWLSVHTAYILITVLTQYVSPHSLITPAGVTSDHIQESYCWLKSGQNYNAEKINNSGEQAVCALNNQAVASLSSIPGKKLLVEIFVTR